MREEDLSLPAADGLPLAATLFEPSGAADRAVLVVPATGVPRRFYAPVCRHLARRGMACLSWDWRGIGGSAPPGSLRHVDATMLDWGEKDLEGALGWAARRWRGATLLAVGHSFGGQALGLAPSAVGLAGAVTVASQSGYLGHWPLTRALLFAGLWYVVVPVLTRLRGYFPAGLLGLGEDLPAGVALQWARWCRSPDYLGRWEGHARLRFPILSLSFSDDAYASRRSVEWLNARFTGAPVEHRHLTPDELGVDEIGHLGFFREGRVPALWNEVAGWLEGRG